MVSCEGKMINDARSLMCEISLWAWIGAVIGFILCSFQSRGVFNSRAAALWGGCLLVFYALWIAGMLKA